ncbi:hypothetical protein BT69DRAFT_1282234, partial [Atractiella rhizophila]
TQATHEGVGAFFSALGSSAHTVMEECVHLVLEHLYKYPELEPVGKVRNIHLYLREGPGC